MWRCVGQVARRTNLVREGVLLVSLEDLDGHWQTLPFRTTYIAETTTLSELQEEGERQEQEAHKRSLFSDKAVEEISRVEDHTNIISFTEV